MVADVGEGVAVGSDDDAVPAVAVRPGRCGCVDVVGLEARGSQGGQAEGVEQGTGPVQLVDEFRVLLGPASLVGGVEVPAYRRGAVIEPEDNGVRYLKIPLNVL